MKKITAFRQRKRLSAILVLITFLFAAVAAKLIYVGVVNASELRVKALEQW